MQDWLDNSQEKDFLPYVLHISVYSVTCTKGTLQVPADVADTSEKSIPHKCFA